MTLYSTDPDYLNILKHVKLFHNEPEGFTNYLGQSASDKLYPKQLNVIIALLVAQNQTLKHIESRIEKLEASFKNS